MQNILLLHVTRIFNKWNYNNKDVSVQNNRYVRLKSLVVGYSLPQKWISKAGLSKLRVYFSGDDLWEWTKVKDRYDPEYGGKISNNTFPVQQIADIRSRCYILITC